MEAKEITLDKRQVAGLTLIAVARVWRYKWPGGGGRFVSLAAKEPVAVITLSPGGRKAYRTSGEEITLEQLSEELPEIREKLAELIGEE